MSGVSRLCLEGFDQSAGAEDVHDAPEIVGQHVQRHLGADPFERLHLEVRCPHPGLDGAEGMLDRLAACAHLLGVRVEPHLDSLKKMFVLPAGDAALLAGRTLILDGAGLTHLGPIAIQRQLSLMALALADQALASGAEIDVLIGQVDKVLLSEPARPASRSSRRLDCTRFR